MQVCTRFWNVDAAIFLVSRQRQEPSFIRFRRMCRSSTLSVWRLISDSILVAKPLSFSCSTIGKCYSEIPWTKILLLLLYKLSLSAHSPENSSSKLGIIFKYIYTFIFLYYYIIILYYIYYIIFIIFIYRKRKGLNIDVSIIKYFDDPKIIEALKKD